MRKTKAGKIALKDIKHIENSRMRGEDEVSDLMGDIEQRGLMEPVGIRKEDSALIYGNRRVRAFEKLGYKDIPCEFYEEVSDEELITMNLAENMKRKNIKTLEIGKMIVLLMDKGYEKAEIAQLLGMKVDRVSVAANVYKVTKDSHFAKIITHLKTSKSRGLISERLVWQIQTKVPRILGRALNKKEWDQILRACEEERLHTKNLPQFVSILTIDSKIDINRALDLLEKVKTMYYTIPVVRDEWEKALRQEKISNDNEFVKLLIKQYNKNILF